MAATDIVERCTAKTDIALEHEVALAPYTSIKIGGPAEWFAAIGDIGELQRLVQWAQQNGIGYFVLGGGSNILVSDKGIRGLVILNRCKRVHFDAELESNETNLTAESGALMAGVARQAVQRKLRGLEWAVSLPGTVGGAVVGNAGAYGSEVKDNLISARIVSPAGVVESMDNSTMGYEYRDSALKRKRPLRAGNNAVVLDARFRLRSDINGELDTLASEYLAHRRSSQPTESSIGSTFKNPPGDHAGRLIEAAGLKGTRVGGVEVSSVHANFIVNPNGECKATAQNVVDLVKRIQTVVHIKFNIELEPEIQLAGEWK